MVVRTARLTVKSALIKTPALSVTLLPIIILIIAIVYSVRRIMANGLKHQ